MPCTLAVFPRQSPDPGIPSRARPFIVLASPKPLHSGSLSHATRTPMVFDSNPRLSEAPGPPRRHPPTVSPRDGDEHASLEARRSWARLIRKVYEVDPLFCPQCGGTMKVIAVIERPAVVRQILAHLGLPTTAPRLRAPPTRPRIWRRTHRARAPTNLSLTTSPSPIPSWRDRKATGPVCPSPSLVGSEPPLLRLTPPAGWW